MCAGHKQQIPYSRQFQNTQSDYAGQSSYIVYTTLAILTIDKLLAVQHSSLE